MHHFCGMVDGLDFLPPDKVKEGMQLLRDNTPEVLRDFVDYFDATYVSGTYTYHAAQNDQAASATLIELFRRGKPIPARRITKVTVNHQQRLLNIISKYNDQTKTLGETITALGYNIRMK
ncbi:uncharacterized protein LOC117114281 [Anneissia japonica]|uniref:uncharacterized protein LOC117114281 n=1 Tax=Anneissia japonica TaxID=1529436 RepID=UPI0014255EE9|nr:uncharacterized protein LOC117114281 [Anneissia japonica]